MKNLIPIILCCLMATACTPKKTSAPTQTLLEGEHWKLIKMLEGGGMAGQQAQPVDYEEEYVFAKNGEFQKRSKGQLANGTYIQREDEWELNYTVHSNLIVNCADHRVEYLQQNNDQLELSSAACDGPTFYYFKSSN